MIMTAGTTIMTMKILMTIPTTTTMTHEDCNDENIKHSTDNIMTIRPMKTLKVAIKIIVLRLKQNDNDDDNRQKYQS